MKTNTKTVTKNDLEMLFSDNYSLFNVKNEIVKSAKEQSNNSIGSIDESALNSIQTLFDAEYSKSGHDGAIAYGKEISKSFRDEDVNAILSATHEKQITGEIMDKVMKSETAVSFIKNNVKPPAGSDKDTKEAVVNIWKEAWESLKRNIGVLIQIGGGAVKAAWNAFENAKSWFVGAGLAIWALFKYYGKQLAKIFKFLKFIPGLSIVLDVSLAIKNIYYIQKELVDGDWNETMEAIEQPAFMIAEPEGSPKINYPGSISRLIGGSLDSLTEKIKPAFSAGMVALKCSAAGFKVAEVFNQVLEQKEQEFLSGQLSAEDFAISVANHIKASRKIKLVCSEMIGLVCNVSSALFDVVAAFIGIGTIISIIGNLLIAGVDMAVREAIIISCKTFEDFWTKKMLDYKQLFVFYFNFANDSDKRLSGDTSNNDFDKQNGFIEVEKRLVDKKTIEEKNQEAFDSTREEKYEKKAG
jgi:hypothetical protein